MAACPKPSASIAELWIYPIKGIRGVQVDSAKLTPTGLELDRNWCIIDLEGVNAPPREAISKRKMPALATIDLSLSQDRQTMTLSAPGMADIAIPTAREAYDNEEPCQVECSGKSTTTGLGWSFGFVDGKSSKAGSEWINAYLNKADPNKEGLLLSGKPGKSTYALVRGPKQGISMMSYPPVFPVISKSKTDPDYAIRMKGNAKCFSDFAPMLFVSKSSNRALSDACADGKTYPINSFRGNVVIDGHPAWAEENWRTLRLVQKGEPTLLLRQIKACPRCTVPCREEKTGEFIYPSECTKMWKVLKKLFPRKYGDPEWGAWGGAFFGSYYGHAGQEGTLSVGDGLAVLEVRAWDEHLRSPWPKRLVALGLAAGLGGVALLAWRRRKAAA